MRLVAISEAGRRMGEGHGRAKLSDHDIDLIQSLLECRDALIEEYQKVGLPLRQIHWTLRRAQLGYGGIASKFECSKRLIRDIHSGKVRNLCAAKFKRVPDKEECTQ